MATEETTRIKQQTTYKSLTKSCFKKPLDLTIAYGWRGLSDAIGEQSHTLSTGMKVTIRKWNAVATWRWDIPEDDVCGICQVHFDGTCPSCKYPGDDCSLRGFQSISCLDGRISALSHLQTVSGKCGHNFHMVSRFGIASVPRQAKWLSLSIV